MGFLLKNIKKTYIWTGAIALICCALMVIFPETALFSAQKSISLWANSVLPALLPFFICANFLGRIGVTSLLKKEIFPFAMSVLSGYPMGAKIIGDMGRTGEISRREAMYLLSFCSTSGPTFIIGAVGIGMLNSVAAGVVCAAAHYFAALLNGVFYKKILSTKKLLKSNDRGSRVSPGKSRGGTLENFTEAVFSAFKALGIILAYIVLFMFVTDLLRMSGAFDLIGDPCFRALAKGFFEMTVGCSSLLQDINIEMTTACSICAVIISWGGLSVIAQSMSMVAGLGIKPAYIIAVKATHSLIAGLLAFLICTFML